jgi:hypothetical protein
MLNEQDKKFANAIAEALTRQKQEKQRVAQLAKGLTQTHPDDFSVTALVNDCLTKICATTAFEVKFKEGLVPLTLSVGVARWRNGTTTEEVNISPENGSWMDDDAISYRLDINTGTQAAQEHQRLTELDDECELRTALLNSFDTNEYGDPVECSDRYAESTIKAEGAATIIGDARNLHRPLHYGGYVSGISLSEFRQWVVDQQRRGVNISGLLESSL